MTKKTKSKNKLSILLFIPFILGLLVIIFYLLNSSQSKYSDQTTLNDENNRTPRPTHEIKGETYKAKDSFGYPVTFEILKENERYRVVNVIDSDGTLGDRYVLKKINGEWDLYTDHFEIMGCGFHKEHGMSEEDRMFIGLPEECDFEE